MVHGVENYRKTEPRTFPYMLCAFMTKEGHNEGYQRVHIPSQTYAIFPSERFSWDEDLGKVLGDLHKRFYTEWLPTAEYEKIDGANFEIYGGTKDYGYIELWLPVVKK